MYTPVNPSFTIQKWGLRGSKLYRYVFVMKIQPQSSLGSGSDFYGFFLFLFFCFFFSPYLAMAAMLLNDAELFKQILVKTL